MTNYRDTRHALRTLRQFEIDQVNGMTEWDGEPLWAVIENAWTNVIDAFDGDNERAGAAANTQERIWRVTR